MVESVSRSLVLNINEVLLRNVKFDESARKYLILDGRPDGEALVTICLETRIQKICIPLCRPVSVVSLSELSQVILFIDYNYRAEVFTFALTIDGQKLPYVEVYKPTSLFQAE